MKPTVPKPPLGPAASPAHAGELDMTIEPLGLDNVDAVMAIEQQAYAYPWSRGNVTDSLAAGHRVVGLWIRPSLLDVRALVAYCVSMAGVEERHLLNLTVAPAHQRRGHAQRLLDDLLAHARMQGELRVWLEVRQSNRAARELYARHGFQAIGVRRGYYPDGQNRREDAVVLALDTLPDTLPKTARQTSPTGGGRAQQATAPQNHPSGARHG